ncbi:DUF3883 domain-containing protein [Bacillus sp. RC]|nr:DUF3883 domain-containing protein [Bacillus sp. RC]
MRLFKEINWGLQEIKRYRSKYNMHIGRSYLEKLLRESIIFNNNDVLSNMLKYDFITAAINEIKLTEIGEEMIKLASDRYELSTQQKRLVSNIYIRNNSSLSKEWLMLFSRGKMYIDRNSIKLSFQQFTEDMIELNVARQENNLVYLDTRYAEKMLDFEKEGMTEEELLKVLETNKMLGEIAEEIALQFEKKRLVLAGRSDLANRVVLISKADVSAGYDMKSFKDANSEIYDAFIEVKYFNNNHFYISENELKTAELIKEDYYLYLVNTDTRSIQIINAPCENLKKISKSIEAVSIKCTL